MIIKKSTLYLIGILIILIISGMFMLSNNQNTSLIGENSDDYQKVVLGFKNYNYYPNTVYVQSGKTVRLSLDSSVSGCFRSFTIKEFGISKNLITPNDYIEFTPTKKGTYKFSCSMGMGTGTLVVE